MVAGRRHPASEVRGDGREELPCFRSQGQPGEATSRLRPGAVTLRSYPEPKARGGSWKEPPTPEARARSQEEQPRSSTAQAQEGLEELSHVEDQERWR